MSKAHKVPWTQAARQHTQKMLGLVLRSSEDLQPFPFRMIEWNGMESILLPGGRMLYGGQTSQMTHLPYLVNSILSNKRPGWFPHCSCSHDCVYLITAGRQFPPKMRTYTLVPINNKSSSVPLMFKPLLLPA